MEDLIRQFRAYSDDGESILVLEYRKIKDIFTSPNTAENAMYSMPRFVTPEGEKVIDVNGAYQVRGRDKLFYETEDKKIK